MSIQRVGYWRCFVAAFLAVVVIHPRLQAETASRRLIDVARPATRPAGAPNYSDVSFSSRWVHPRNEHDPHDSFEAIEAFHATRLDWAYITDRKFIREIKRRGLTFCPATNSSAFVGELRPKQKRGRIVDLEGNIVTAPWMRMWKHSSWGCVNSPDYRRSYLTRLEQLADLGADSIQTDDPGNNWTATNWGACFCAHCMSGFRFFLKNNTKEEQREEWGIQDVDTFRYDDHLRQREAPVGDAFGPWDGGPLKKQFVAFQRESVERFYRDMWSALDKHAGRHVPVSCNNYAGRWSFPYHLFDYGMAELPHRDAHPPRIRTKFVEARQRGKAQIFTFVSTDVQETRRVIAACYANGGHLIVPWDVYLKSTPEGSDRYFGKPEEYADLYGFVREHARFFDGYEDALAVGPGLVDDRYPSPPLVIAGSDEVFAFVRVQPGQPDAPIVVHLLGIADSPQSCKITWQQPAFFGGRPVRAQLLRPGVGSQDLAIRSTEASLSVQIGDLKLWSLLILSLR